MWPFDFLKRFLSGPPEPEGGMELREFTLDGKTHVLAVPKTTFEVSRDKLSFWQSYVQEEALAAKRLILRLRQEHGDRWREHVGEVEPWLRRELQEDLTLPVTVAEHPEKKGHYVVLNGAHTAYVLMEAGHPVTVKIDAHNQRLAKGTKLYKLHEVRVESSRR